MVRILPQGEWRRAATQKALLMILLKRFLTKRIGPEEEVLTSDTDTVYKPPPLCGPGTPPGQQLNFN